MPNTILRPDEAAKMIFADCERVRKRLKMKKVDFYSVVLPCLGPCYVVKKKKKIK